MEAMEAIKSEETGNGNGNGNGNVNVTTAPIQAVVTDLSKSLAQIDTTVAADPKGAADAAIKALVSTRPTFTADEIHAEHKRAMRKVLGRAYTEAAIRVGMIERNK